MIGQFFIEVNIPYILSYVKTKLIKRGQKMARIIDGKKCNMIGSNVERRRKELKMSQQKLSDKLELYAVYVCRGSISRIEDYSRTVTDIELYALAKALKTDINDLFDKDMINYD